MNNVLAIIEHRDGALRGTSLPAVSVARQAASSTGGKAILLVLGGDVSAVADTAAAYGDVLVASDAALSDYTADAWAPIVAQAARAQGARLVVGTATSLGKDLLPRVAALLDAGMASDISALLSVDGDAVRVKRPMWAGNVIGTVEVSGSVAVLSVRGTEIDAAAPQAAPGTVGPLAFELGAHANRTRVLGLTGSGGGSRPDASEARVVVAGGRGLKGPDNFPMLEKLTDLMGGGIGASRAATDAGWVPPDWQIGQTGKVVAPDLYFAIGISGAIQHLAGMKASKTIVAINKDPEAPIFQVADYGLVADLFEAVPELIALLG